MKTAVIFALVIAAVSAASLPKEFTPERIVGGSVTTIDQYPYMVAMLYGSGSWFSQACGGAVLTSRTVLSAAHCFVSWLGAVDQPARWRARVGSSFASSGGSVHEFNLISVHNNYNTRTFDNDVAVLRVSAAFSLGSNIAAGTIAGPNYNVADNAVVWAMGWGTTSEGGSQSEQLRHVQIWTVSQAVCRQRYGTSAITDNMLCIGWLDVGGRDQCQGDSGGPLIQRASQDVIIGVCSWGTGCARPYFPGVNARVSAVSNWISSTVASM